MYRNETQNCSLYIIQDWSRPMYFIYISTITYLSITSMLAQAQLGVYLGPLLQIYSPTNIALIRQFHQHPHGDGLPCILACAGQVQI